MYANGIDRCALTACVTVTCQRAVRVGGAQALFRAAIPPGTHVRVCPCVCGSVWVGVCVCASDPGVVGRVFFIFAQICVCADMCVRKPGKLAPLERSAPRLSNGSCAVALRVPLAPLQAPLGALNVTPRDNRI